MIIDHQYQTSYAGVHPANRRCAHLYEDDTRCNGLPQNHMRTVAPADAHGEPEFDIITKPAHYNKHPSGVECVEIARHLSGDWFNAFKYVFRADLKNGKQDIEKANYYSTDALTHGIPMRGFGWGAHQDDLLRQVIEAEPDHNRKRFYTAVLKCWRLEANEAVIDILAEYP